MKNKSSRERAERLRILALIERIEKEQKEMAKKEKIVQILKKRFSSVYCDTCKCEEGNYDDCDYCHRKSMYWSIGDRRAEEIADEIIEACK